MNSECSFFFHYSWLDHIAFCLRRDGTEMSKGGSWHKWKECWKIWKKGNVIIRPGSDAECLFTAGRGTLYFYSCFRTKLWKWSSFHEKLKYDCLLIADSDNVPLWNVGIVWIILLTSGCAIHCIIEELLWLF